MSTLRAIAHCRSVLAAVPVRPTTQQWRPFSHGRFLTAQTLNLSEKETAELNVLPLSYYYSLNLQFLTSLP